VAHDEQTELVIESWMAQMIVMLIDDDATGSG
jgi:hypothetical protein